ncbi:MAG: SURF1 family protein [Nocardioidaceae bacterium]
MHIFLNRRAMGLLLVAVALMSVMVWLGLWQLGAYDQHQRDSSVSAEHQQPVPLDQLLGPDQAFPSAAVGRPVEVSGRFVTGQFYVRSFDGAVRTYAVVTPLLTSTGSAVLVVRGSSDVAAARAPSGQVRVTGVLEPSQAAAAPLSNDRVTNGIRIAGLVSEVSRDLYDGYLVATDGVSATELAAVEPPLPQASRLAGLRNLLYAVQWWVFAAFVAFMWWQTVKDSETGVG